MAFQENCLAETPDDAVWEPAFEARDLNASVCLGGRMVEISGHVCGPAGAPVVVAMGGISAHRFAADHDGAKGWWRDQAGPGRAIDTDRVRLLTLDYPGEAVSPFPSTHDQARAVLALLDELAADRARVIGASYGGMVALALAGLAPARIESALVISAADRSPAMAKAWRSIQRETVALGLRLGDGAAGLDLARRLAMTTYRTPDEFESRFGRDGAECVESYLTARGSAYADTVSPERFLALSQSLDAHRVEVCGLVCPVTYVAVREDRLAPPEQIRAAARATPRGAYHEFSSLYGHDAFLKEAAAISFCIETFLTTETA